jgi:hypothetical protein
MKVKNFNPRMKADKSQCRFMRLWRASHIFFCFFRGFGDLRGQIFRFYLRASAD